MGLGYVSTGGLMLAAGQTDHHSCSGSTVPFVAWQVELCADHGPLPMTDLFGGWLTSEQSRQMAQGLVGGVCVCVS